MMLGGGVMGYWATSGLLMMAGPCAGSQDICQDI